MELFSCPICRQLDCPGRQQSAAPGLIRLSHTVETPSPKVARKVAEHVRFPFVTARVQRGLDLELTDVEVTVSLCVDSQASVRPDAFRVRAGLMIATTLLRQARTLAEQLLARELAGSPQDPVEEYFGSFAEQLAWGSPREALTSHHERILRDHVGLETTALDLPGFRVTLKDIDINILLGADGWHSCLVSKIPVADPDVVVRRAEPNVDRGQSLWVARVGGDSAIWVWTDVVTDLFADLLPDPMKAAAAFHRAIPQHLSAALEVVYSDAVTGVDPEGFLRRLAS